MDYGAEDFYWSVMSSRAASEYPEEAFKVAFLAVSEPYKCRGFWPLAYCHGDVSDEKASFASHR